MPKIMDALHDMFEPSSERMPIENLVEGDLFYTPHGQALYQLCYLGFGVQIGSSGQSLKLYKKDNIQYVHMAKLRERPEAETGEFIVLEKGRYTTEKSLNKAQKEAVERSSKYGTDFIIYKAIRKAETKQVPIPSTQTKIVDYP